MENLIGETLGGCIIESKIGQGGMGAVYLAHHVKLNMPVAVKVLHLSTQLGASEDRFLREAQITARLHHTNIVGVMNTGVENGIHYIVMEYVKGCNLQTLIEKEKLLPFDKAISIATDVLHALETALEQGIIHRDIKPENILISTSGVAKLADLGLARVTGGENLTQSNTMLGSPYYVAPEQVENPSTVDCRADIYSLGCTMYHMVSGTAPYPGSTLIEIVMNHVQKPVPHLREKVKNIPEYLAEIVFTMMQKDPSKRYASPTEVLRALEYRKSTIIPSSPVNFSNVNKSSKQSSRFFPIIAASCIIIVVALFVFLPAYRKDRHITITPAFIPDSIAPVQDTLAKAENDSTPSVKKSPVKKRAHQKVASTVSVASNDNKQTPEENPLIAVVKIGDTEGIRALLAKGVSPKCDKSAPTTPLHETVRRGMTIETELLLQAGADTDARDKNGNTALHYAVKENASLMVKILLDNGANPNVKDRSGKTPLKMAESIDSKLERMLEKYGAK